MNSFIWNGKDSYEDFGIVITKLPPEVIPESDIEEIPITGRDGDLTIDNNAKKSYTLPIDCTLLDSNRIQEVKMWLIGGLGDLIFNWQQDFKYEAKLNNKIDIAQSMTICGEFQITFKVKPYKKSINDNVVVLESTGTLYNSSGNISKPIIKLYGTGNITLMVNSQTVKLTSISEYITIDSNMQNAYKDTLPQNSNMDSEFPVLEVGNNTVSWSGNVTKVVITPHWRYL